MKPNQCALRCSLLRCLQAFGSESNANEGQLIRLRDLRATWACTGFRQRDLRVALNLFIRVDGVRLEYEESEGAALIVSKVAVEEFRQSYKRTPVSERLRGRLARAVNAARSPSKSGEGRARRLSDALPSQLKGLGTWRA